MCAIARLAAGLKLLNATDRDHEPALDYQSLGRQAWVGLRYEAKVTLMNAWHRPVVGLALGCPGSPGRRGGRRPRPRGRAGRRAAARVTLCRR
jgi:hypothetical protein